MRLSWPFQARGHAFLKRLPWRVRVLFFIAVMFTFCSVGFVVDSMNVQLMDPWPYVIVTVVFTGLTAVMYAVAISTSRGLIPIAIGIQILFPYYVFPSLRRAWHIVRNTAPIVVDPARIAERLQADGIGAAICIILGYIFFIRLIASEGRRHLRLETEIGLAQKIHDNLVPPLTGSSARFEWLGRSEPSSEVGGDLVDVIEHDGTLIACVADVAGHGVPAGAFMGMVKSAMRMRLLSATDLQSLLGDLDRVIEQIRRPEMFVTFAGLRFDSTSAAEAGIAGHLPILHYRTATGAIEAIENLHPPLGVVGAGRPVTSRVPFAPGDLFVILTDGLTEVENRHRDQLGIPGLVDVLGRHAGETLADVHAALVGAARAHGPQTDDQTLLLVRIR